MDEESIFAASLAEQAPGQRVAFLDQACAGDAVLRSRVEALLRAHDNPDSFLEAPDAHCLGTIDAPVRERPGTVIGPYKLLEEIGEGGFGIVFMAEQQKPLRRRVALKVLKPGMDTRQVIARFEAERQALALMDHPNIAQVHDGGETAGGRPYFVMELVKGTPITAYCDQAQLAPRQRLELFLTVCQAVQHAHQKGIIHRDLKPSNVMVALHDGTPVVKVIDFGIAKATAAPLTDKTLFTGFAQMIGTPMYMSPEQAGQTGLDVDTRSDIYSLGVLLYELLTGTTPFDKERLKEASYEEIRRIIREEEPARPSTRLSTQGAVAATVSANRHSDPKRLSQLLRGELDWIVMKALEKDRNRRYETANALAADVQRYLNDEPVQACPPSAWYRLRKLVRRNRGAVLAVSIVIAGLLIGAAVSTWQAVRATLAESDAIAGWADAEQKGKAAVKAQQKANKDRTRAKQAEAEAKGSAAEAKQAAAEAKRAAAKAEAVNSFLIQSVLGSTRAWSHPGDQTQMVKVLDAAAGDLDRLFAAQPDAEAAVRLTIGELYYSVGLPAKAEPHLRRGLHLRRGKRTAPLDPLQPEDAETLYAMKHLGTLLRDRGNLAEAEPLLRRSQAALGRAEMRRITCRVPASPVTVHMMSVAFSPDSRRLLAGGDDNCLRLFDVATGIEVHRFARASWFGNFSPDGCRILSGGHNNTLRLWDTATGKELRQFKGHTDLVLSVGFSPDGRLALSSSNDKTIRLWNVETGQEVRRFRGHTAGVRNVVFAPDGRRVLSGSEDGTVRLWDAATGREIRRFLEGRASVWSVAVSADGRRALSMDDRATRLWDLDTGQEIRRSQGNLGFGWVVFAPDGHRALRTDHMERKLRLWDVDTGQELKCFSVEMPLRPQRAVISPDGRLAASGNWRGSVSLWRLTDPPAPAQELAEALQALKSARRARRPEHPDTLAARHDLGALLWEQGKLAAAEPHFRQGLQAKRRVLGPEHPETLFALRELAALLQAQDKAAEAEPLLRQYVAASRRAQPDHPDTLVALADLCALFQGQGRRADAEPFWRQRWQGWCRLLGPEHPETRGALPGLIEALASNGKAAEIEALYAEQIAKLGPDHPDTLSTLHNLAWAYYMGRKLPEAIRLFEQVRDKRVALLGPDHRDTRTTLHNLAGAYYMAGEFVKSEALYRAFFDQARRQFGTEHPQTAAAMAGLGLTLLQQKKSAEAEPILRACLTIRAKKEPDAWTTFNTKSMLGGALLGQKKYADAEALLIQGYEGMNQRAAKIPEMGKARLTEGLERLVQLYDAWGKKDKAAKWQRKLEEAKTAAKPPAKP